MKMLCRLSRMWIALLLAAALPAATLQEQISAFVTQPRFAGAAWGVKVVSLDSGKTLAEFQPRLRLSPASNAKLYVGALALDQLGGDYRIRTPLRATTAIQADGTLAGDLVVSGRGDPSWGARENSASYDSVFGSFVAALKQAGVKRIHGDVIADGSWLRVEPAAPGWTVDDLSYYYGAEISGVSFLDNYAEIRAAPGVSVDNPGVLEWLEPLTDLTLVNKTRTLPANAVASVEARLLPGTRTVEVSGGVALGAKAAVTESPVPRPSQWFAAGLKAALERAGIAVTGQARSVVWPESAPVAPVRVGEVTSPPLRQLVAGFMKSSQNLETNLVFSHLGELRRKTEMRADRRSDELAVEALKEFADKAGLPAGDLIFEEGSGLSRNNLTTPEATIALLRYMAQHREAAAFADSLPVAGRDGSLRKRLKGTSAEANLHAKTGSLRWAATLSGYATTTTGERVAFSLMLNRHVATAGLSARDEIDALAVIVAGASGGSARAPAK